MQQVAGGKRFWWRAFEAHTSGPGIAFRQQFLSYPEETARALDHDRRKPARKRPSLTLQIPRGERRFRAYRRPPLRIGKYLLSIGAMMLVVGAAAAALPLKRLKAIDFGSELGAKAGELMVASGFGIDQVNVSGQRYTADTDVFDALDLPNVRTIADFDSEAALKRIERIPWVDKAQITRVYPGTLDVVVRERAPAVVWTRGDKNYLVDATGRVLGLAPANGGWDLPRVVGEGADSEATALLAALHQYPALERQYAYGERIAERRWRVVLKNGTALDLGADREIESLQEIVDAGAVAAAITGAPMIIDVRTPGRIAVRPSDRKLAKMAALSAPLADRQQ